MRTTVRLDDQLLKEARQLAATTGKTLTDIIEEALRERLRRRHQASRRKRVELPTFKGDGLKPGVNIEDSAGLLEIMNERDAPS